MNRLINIWIDEIRRFNMSLHLVGPQVLKHLDKEIESCLKLIKPINEDILADLGTGSGIPGIPYAVMNPNSEVKLIERSEKKCIFLSHCISCMGLENAEILEADPLIKDFGKFPAAISRAFSPKELLSKAVAAILENNGMFYYMSSGRPLLDSRFLPVKCIETSINERMKIYSYRFTPLK
jgi:16S rRNA (guanine527-N7)-methyltransferase